MALNRDTGGAYIAHVAEAQLGKPYSEQSPQGSDGDGHYWVPGEPWPTYFDCSGLDATCTLAAGIHISNGNANDQWTQHMGGVVPRNVPLRAGDLGFFLGSDLTPGYAGHTGIVKTYDESTGMFVMINAADQAQGVCLSESSRDETQGVLAVLGFTRPANVLPLPHAPNVDPPTPAELAAHRLVGLQTATEAQQALDNGWTLFIWSDAETFVLAKVREPYDTIEYAGINWRTKR